LSYRRPLPDLAPARALEQELAQIELAEEFGFDSVWLAEHHFTNYCVINDPLTYAAHVAARTTRIRIGLAVSILPLHHPVEIAERAALVDILSNGRLDVGLGRGYSSHSFGNFGVGMDERRGRFDEALDVITRLWTEDTVDHEGAFWKIDGASLYPKPLQQPHPPVYIASSGSPDTIAYAAEHRYPLIQGVDFLTPESVASRYAQYRRAGEAAGLSRLEIEGGVAASPVTQKVFVSEHREDAHRIPEPYAMWRHRRIGEMSPSGPPPSVIARARRQLRPLRKAVTGRSAIDWDQMDWDYLSQFDVYGNPDDCIEKIGAMADAGMRSMICWFAYGGMPDEHVRSAMTLFAREVMPAFQDARTPTREGALVG
jgi:alkanesulfonate monooxygenase SsuD/methylene tetrahydromethanopterin reductase-like flavin-dependent oxidoreductase (luciferase family)